MDTEIAQSIIELKQAEQNFNYADSDFVNSAIFQLAASVMKVNALIRLKTKGPTPMDP